MGMAVGILLHCEGQDAVALVVVEGDPTVLFIEAAVRLERIAIRLHEIHVTPCVPSN